MVFRTSSYPSISFARTILAPGVKPVDYTDLMMVRHFIDDPTFPPPSDMFPWVPCSLNAHYSHLMVGKRAVHILLVIICLRYSKCQRKSCLPCPHIMEDRRKCSELAKSSASNVNCNQLLIACNICSMILISSKSVINLTKLLNCAQALTKILLKCLEDIFQSRKSKTVSTVSLS